MMVMSYKMKERERFELRWELRSSKVDGDTSSDDEETNSRGDPRSNKHKTITDLLLYDDANDDDSVSQNVKANEDKMKSSKKKKVVQKKSVKKVKRKIKHSINEKGVFKDLKIFADSLVHELAVARESMVLDMRNEMRNMIASESDRGNVQRNVVDPTRAYEQQHKFDRPRLSTIANMNSSLQFHQLQYHSSVSAGTDICRLMAAKGMSLRLPLHSPHHNTWSLYGESRRSYSSQPFMGLSATNVARIASTSRASLEGIIPGTVRGKTDGFFAGSQGQSDGVCFNLATPSEI